jgi:calcium permeable stress-gated cation channel
MDKSGKAVKSSMPGFELVPEGRLDFEYYKNRPEFASEHGGGEIYGRHADSVRPGTPGSMWNGSEPPSRPGSPGLPPVPRTASPGPGRTYSPLAGNASPKVNLPEPGRSRSPLYAMDDDSGLNLVNNAAAMPMTTPHREPSMDHPALRAPGGAGMLGGGPRGYGNLPQDEDMTPEHDPMAYDYFRSTRTRRS